MDSVETGFVIAVFRISPLLIADTKYPSGTALRMNLVVILGSGPESGFISAVCVNGWKPRKDKNRIPLDKHQHLYTCIREENGRLIRTCEIKCWLFGSRKRFL